MGAYTCSIFGPLQPKERIAASRRAAYDYLWRSRVKYLTARSIGLFAAIGLFITAAAFGADSENAFIQSGYASWYGGKFQGRKTASGEIFDTNKLTAAHKRLPFGTHVEVTNLANGKSVVVRINDRGPFVEGRIIDLSRAAAVRIDMLGSGVAEVKIRVVDPRNKSKTDSDATDIPPRNAPETELDAESGLPLPTLPDVPKNADDSLDPRDNPIYTFPEPKSYTIQIASFSSRDNAARLHRLLQEAGLSPSYEKSGAGHYRVVLSEVDPDRVERVKEKLAELGHTSVLLRENL